MFRCEDFDPFGFRPTAHDVKAAQEFLAVFLIKGLVDEDFVLLVDFVTRVGEGEGKVAVIGDDEQALTVHVEPAHVVDARPPGRQQFKDGAALTFVVGGADVAAGFGEHGGERLLLADDAGADFYGVLGADFGGEVGDEVAVDADLPGGDEFLHATAGAEAGGGEKTIKAHGVEKFGERTMALVRRIRSSKSGFSQDSPRGEWRETASGVVNRPPARWTRMSIMGRA